MKTITILALASLVVCFTQGLEIRTIESKANKCCFVGCSSSEVDSLKSLITSSTGSVAGSSLSKEDAAIVRFARRVVSGEQSCPKGSAVGRTRSNVARTTTGSGTLNITCPTGPFNASTKAVSVICHINTNIYNDTLYYITAYATGPNGQNVYQYIYLYQTPVSYYSGVLNFTLPEYAASGIWYVYAYAYDMSYANYISSTTRNFTVAVGKNDNTPPVVHSAVASTFSVSPCMQSNYLTLNVSDNLSGIASISVYAYSSAGDAISWYMIYANPLTGNQIITVPGNAYGTLVAGVQYYIEITLTDAALNDVYYDSSDDAVIPYITPVTSPCFAGSFAPVGTSTCQQCPANKFSNNGSFACCACPAGTISAGPGASSCIPCPFGYYSLGGSTQCTKCPAGTYNYNTGAAVCTPCSSGSTSVAGSQYCNECPPGLTSCPGDTSCSACPKGTYSDYGFCMKCAPGTFAATAGSSVCAFCPANTFSAAVGAISCTACPSGKHGPAGSNSNLNCA